MIRIHEIESYLQDVEYLVNNLKTELDLTRNLLYRTWYHHRKNCILSRSKLTIPDGVDFIIRVDGKNTLLSVEESSGSNYSKIMNQIVELGFGSGQTEPVEKITVNKSRIVYDLLGERLKNYPYETFYLVLLNNGNRLIKTVCVSEGGITGTVIDPKKLFKIALDCHSTGMILVHNHPSGNLRPSDRDVSLTKKIISGGNLLDINVMDHIIIGEDGYLSFSDEGMMG